MISWDYAGLLANHHECTMNTLKRLMSEHCPHGVEYRELGEVAELKRGTSITKKNISSGDIPVIAGGRKAAYYHNKGNRDGETIVIAGSGAYAGFVSYWTTEIFVSDAFSIKTNKYLLLTKYAFHFLKNCQNVLHNLKSGSGVPHVYSKDVAKLPIPIPPLPVQEAIVKILDSFTELEAELEARVAQYKYYREKLLTFGHDVEYRELGEIAKYVRGVTYNKSQETTLNSGFKILRANNIDILNNRLNFEDVKVVSKDTKIKDTQKLKKGDILMSVASGSKAHVGKVAYINNNIDYYFGGFMAVIRCNKSINSQFIFYLLGSGNFLQYLKKSICSTTINNINSSIINKFSIPIPPLAEQERIVSLLDKFDALVNDISIGLPAELKARRAQYEYYREYLLSFEATRNTM